MEAYHDAKNLSSENANASLNFSTIFNLLATRISLKKQGNWLVSRKTLKARLQCLNFRRHLATSRQATVLHRQRLKHILKYWSSSGNSNLVAEVARVEKDQQRDCKHCVTDSKRIRGSQFSYEKGRDHNARTRKAISTPLLCTMARVDARISSKCA